MILVDANILIYAIDQDSPHHARAQAWLEETLSRDTWVGLPWIVILACESSADAPRISIAFEEARRTQRPVAVLMADEYHGFNR